VVSVLADLSRIIQWRREIPVRLGCAIKMARRRIWVNAERRVYNRPADGSLLEANRGGGASPGVAGAIVNNGTSWLHRWKGSVTFNVPGLGRARIASLSYVTAAQERGGEWVRGGGVSDVSHERTSMLE
jgi:hypothetical protein